MTLGTLIAIAGTVELVALLATLVGLVRRGRRRTGLIEERARAPRTGSGLDEAA
ncbi:MAG TPA: hypothetical protein VFP65_05000 [Anaeromyxobacteraceae bacterium]|nr:hypothetical protein [Anaeromyxobacteraceae bacterium]